MKASDLNQLLYGVSSGDILKMHIQEEVSSYQKLLDKKGSSIPLIFSEDEEVILTKQGIHRLLVETLSRRLSNVDLAYICDCLTMGDRVQFADECIEDIVYELADPEINGGFKSNMELNELIERCSTD